MKVDELEKTIVRGVLTLGNRIFMEPEHTAMRDELIKESRVLVSRNIVFYVDENGKKINPQTGYYEMLPTAFASLMTPLCDINLNGNKIYNITYKKPGEFKVLPSEIDLEEVLTEVDRVVFSPDDEFDTKRVLRYSRQRLQPKLYSRAKK